MHLKTLPTFTHDPVPNPLSLFFGGGVFVTAAPHKENKLWVFSPPPTHFMPIIKSYQFQFLNTFPISPHSPHLGTSSLVFSFPGGTRYKEPTCQCRRHKRHRFDPWLGRFPGGEHGNPHQFLAWRIPWTEKPGGLQSIGSQRVRYEWSNLKQHTALFKLPSICACVWASYGWDNKLPQT